MAIFMMTLLVLSTSSCSDAKVKQYKIKVVKEYPHDEMSYTQGLFFQGERMIETTGQWGESTLRLVLEGSVQLGDNIYILTWKNKVAFIYDAKTLAYKQTYSYAREGWGLTTDGKSLIASDGSARLYWLDEQLKQQKSLTVKMNGRPVNQLNELEWIDGRIWANVYMTDMIVIINPETGVVEATVDCTGLLPRHLRDQYTDVLNGIAYNPSTKKIYHTGKYWKRYWKRLYEVELVEKK